MSAALAPPTESRKVAEAHTRDTLEILLQLAGMGMAIIPAGADKAPCVKWKQYQNERPTADQIRTWYSKLNPPVWGQVTGTISARVVIDFDGATGEATRVNMFGNFSPHVKTPSGGWHIHVASPPFNIKTLNHRTSKNAPWTRDFPGVDIRAEGGFEALMGTTDKGSYSILRDLTPYPWELLPWEFRRYFEPPKESAPPTVDQLIARALEKAPNDGRNNAGFWLACQLRDNGYTPLNAESALLQYQGRTGATNTKGALEQYTVEDARKSIAEAYKAAAREPWGGGPKVVIMPAQAADGDLPQWLCDRLIKGAKGKAPMGNLANVATLLREHPDWQRRVRLDELRMRITAVNPTPIGTVRDSLWLDQHDMLATEWMQHHGIFIGKNTVGEAIFMVACECSFHPVKDYLSSLQWDGTPRLDGWLASYCGARGPDAQPSEVLSAVGRKWLVQAVARVMRPGAKADYVLVLEGNQGLYKSTVFSILGDEFYTDDLAAFGSKDASQAVAGTWIIELPELVRLRGANLNMIKAFLSRNVDRFRPPFGKHVVEIPRTNVFCGTTNDDQYLLDVTGNRRIWPVRVFEPASVEALRRDRDQLWAEAVHLFRHHYEYWVHPGSELERLLAGEQEIRVTEDEFEGPVMAWVSSFVSNELSKKERAESANGPIPETRPYVTMFQIFSLALGFEVSGLGVGLARVKELGPRIGRILRKHGWRRYNRGVRGSREYQYHPPADWDWKAVIAAEEHKK